MTTEYETRLKALLTQIKAAGQSLTLGLSPEVHAGRVVHLATEALKILEEKEAWDDNLHG